MNKLASARNDSGTAPTGTTSTGKAYPGWAVLAMLMVGLSAILLLAGGCGDDPANPNFQNPPPQVSPNWLFDVYGTAGDDVYVCGNNGAMYHYDGTDWTRQDMGVPTAIVSFGANDAGTELYVVGHAGRIWRRSGTTWSGMTSGTTQNLYDVGAFGSVMHAVGWAGAIRRLNGSTWNGAGGTMMMLDEAGDPVDTLLVAEDIASLVAVNSYFLGGAYKDPNFEPVNNVPVTGIVGTKGMVLAANTNSALDANWILRPLVGEDPTRAPNEWVLSTHSDARPDSIGRNYLGTTEGWLFRLTTNDDGEAVWDKFYPSFTEDPGAGISAIWLDAVGNVYVVTDEGDLWFQTRDYRLTEGTGERVRLYDGRYRLTGVWGSDPTDLFLVGFEADTVLRGSHNQATGEFTFTRETLPSGAKSASAVSDDFDNGRGLPDDFLGRPLR